MKVRDFRRLLNAVSVLRDDDELLFLDAESSVEFSITSIEEGDNGVYVVGEER